MNFIRKHSELLKFCVCFITLVLTSIFLVTFDAVYGENFPWCCFEHSACYFGLLIPSIGIVGFICAFFNWLGLKIRIMNTDLIPNPKIYRIEVVKSPGIEEDETCQTFVLHHEDHTLGNSLRYIIMKNIDVEYCGYSVPHPSENKINLRIQTRSKAANDILKKGLFDLQKICNHVLTEFQSAVKTFKERSAQGDDDVALNSEDDDDENME